MKSPSLQFCCDFCWWLLSPDITIWLDREDDKIFQWQAFRETRKPAIHICHWCFQLSFLLLKICLCAQIAYMYNVFLYKEQRKIWRAHQISNFNLVCYHIKVIMISCVSIRFTSVVFLYLPILQHCISSSQFLQHPQVLWDQGRVYSKRMQIWFHVPSLDNPWACSLLVKNQEPLKHEVPEAWSLHVPCSKMASAQRMHTE